MEESQLRSSHMVGTKVFSRIRLISHARSEVYIVRTQVLNQNNYMPDRLQVGLIPLHR